MTTEPIDEFKDIVLNGSGASDAIDLGGKRLTGFIFPSGMASATLKVLTSKTFAGTYGELTESHTSGTDFAVTVTSSKGVPITNLAITAPWRFIKIQPASSETSKTVTLVLRPV